LSENYQNPINVSPQTSAHLLAVDHDEEIYYFRQKYRDDSHTILSTGYN